MIFPLFISALLFYLSFPNVFSLEGYYLLAFLFAVPLFFALENRTWYQRLLIGLIFGLVSNLAAVNWMIPYSEPGYLFLSIVLASQALFFAVFYVPSKNKFRNLLFVPSLWVVSEFLRKTIMMGESWDLAHTQSFNIYFLQIANIVGSAGVSFVLIFINYALYCLLRKNGRGIFPLVTIVIFAVYSYGFVTILDQKLGQKPVFKICAIQPNTDFHGEIDDEKVTSILNENMRLTIKAVQYHHPDLIIWPETAIPTDFLQEDLLKSKMSKFVKRMGVPFLVGAAIDDKAGTHNSAVLLNGQGEVVEVYHKRYLVPLTEYIPSTPLWKKFARFFKVHSLNFVPGMNLGVMEVNGKRFGVAICSEDNIDKVFTQYSRQGAQFVIVLLNNGWFSQKSGLIMHGQHSVIHAVENGMPVLRVSNTGWSCLIDHNGRVLTDSLHSLKQQSGFYYEIPLSPTRTVYDFIGDTFCYACLCFVILVRLASFVRNRKRSSLTID